MQEVSDSLAGRCGVLELEGLSIEELGDVFYDREQREGIASLFVRGFMPQLWKDPDLRPADYFSSHQATYLERDVRQLRHALGFKLPQFLSEVATSSLLRLSWRAWG